MQLGEQKPSKHVMNISYFNPSHKLGREHKPCWICCFCFSSTTSNIDFKFCKMSTFFFLTYKIIFIFLQQLTEHIFGRGCTACTTREHILYTKVRGTPGTPKFKNKSWMPRIFLRWNYIYNIYVNHVKKCSNRSSKHNSRNKKGQWIVIGPWIQPTNRTNSEFVFFISHATLIFVLKNLCHNGHGCTGSTRWLGVLDFAPQAWVRKVHCTWSTKLFYLWTREARLLGPPLQLH
jgi:hypothetical protein